MLKAHGRASEIVIEATITRADGRVERLGVVSYWSKSPWKRLLWRIRNTIRWHRL